MCHKNTKKGSDGLGKLPVLQKCGRIDFFNSLGNSFEAIEMMVKNFSSVVVF